MQTVVKMLFGSHLYGTNTPESDLDYKGVFLPSASDIVLQRVKGSIRNCPDKHGEGIKNSPNDVDEELYSLQRFLELLAEGQTVAIDMLFADERVIIESSPVWEIIRANKHRFLTKRSTAFVGYCRTQANKYGIKGSRVAAARKAVELFRAEYEVRGSQAKVFEIKDKLKELLDEHTKIVGATDVRHLEVYFECCNRKVGFNTTIKQAYEIFSRMYQNFGARAKLAEVNEGIDWKALSHAVRVGTEALELLRNGTVTFPMVHSDYLLAIKQGRVSYNAVAQTIEELLVEVEEASQHSDLPAEVDQQFIDNLVENEYRRVIYGL